MFKFQDNAQDKLGKALNGASVSVYDAGTSNLASLFEDDESTPLNNPLTTDDFGRFEFKAANAKYDVKVEKGSVSYRVNGFVFYDPEDAGAPSQFGTMASQDADDVAITGGDAILDTLTLDPAATPPATNEEGRLYWDFTDKTVVAQTGVDDVMLQLGQELTVRARNTTGSTITNGSIVYISGATGNRPQISLAQADAATTADLVGVATHGIEHNTDGYVTINGLVRGIDTSGYTAGDEIYLSAATAGLFTGTPPALPNYVIKIGIVTRVSAGEGVILVNTIPFSKDRRSFEKTRTHADAQFLSYLETAEITAPATPASGYGRLYAKNDGAVYYKNSAGSEFDLTAAGGTSGPIAEGTISTTTAAINLENAFTGAGVYLLTLSEVYVTNDGIGLYIRFSKDGSTADTGIVYQWSVSDRTGGTNGVDDTKLATTFSSIGNVGVERVLRASFLINVYAGNSTADASWDVLHYNAGGNQYNGHGQGQYNGSGTTATGIQVTPSVGSFESGEYKLYKLQGA